MLKDTIELSFGTASLIAPQIIEVHIREGAVIDVDEIIELKTANSKLVGNRGYCIILNSNDFFTSTAEARSLAASVEYRGKRLAIAIATKSLPIRLLGNFFIRFNKPVTPTRVFNNKDDALKWLRKFTETSASPSFKNTVRLY